MENNTMAFDGIVIANIVYDLKQKLEGGRITKIAQPEKDALLLTVKTSKSSEQGTVRSQYRLMISVNPSLPLVYLLEENKPSPMTAPTFCMVLRKHLNNCRIVSITQMGLERVIRMDLEHLNEMGDLCRKYLYIELMGKHSNIIFTEEDDRIVDSIKHISALVSSVREVLPGRTYFIPNTQHKRDPEQITQEIFNGEILKKPLPLSKAIYTSVNGFSPVMANELIHRSSLDDRNSGEELSDMEAQHLYRNFCSLCQDVAQGQFRPQIIYRQDEPVEFASVDLTVYDQNEEFHTQQYESASDMLYTYYSEREAYGRIRQKSSDLRKITVTLLERARKKQDLQEKQLKDTAKRDKYKLYGELLTTYGYSLKGGEKKFVCEDFYSGKEVTIPLDDTLDGVGNAKRYFDKYSKLKRTYEAMQVQLADTVSEVEHLESISNALDIAREEQDLAAIRRELYDWGYIRSQGNGRQKNKNVPKSKPFHYISSDGFHMYVGRNNYQNEELTFHVATGNDWWFHAKKAAGSHVIVKCGNEEMPDRTFEEAAALAAHYSKAADQGKVEIDYIQKKHVKKPNGSKPGFVVYYTNYSMTISPDISHIKEVTE